MKNPMTPDGIELATFRFVAQHLTHCATAVPVTSVRRPNKEGDRKKFQRLGHLEQKDENNLRTFERQIQETQKKRELLKNPTTIEEIQQKKIITRN